MLFSLKHSHATCRTELNIFGIKFKIFNKNLVKRPDYSNALNKVRQKYIKNEKIRVAFLVSENSKWNAEILYNLLENSEYFEPFILVTLLTYVHNGKDKTRNNLEENYTFFKNQGKKVFKAYDEKEHKYINLDEFSTDIIFYQQHWGLAENQEITEASKYSLCCSFCYGFELFEYKLINTPFDEKLYLNFIPTKLISEIKKKYKYNDNDNEIITGFPKLDIYENITINNNKTNTIIYAPHFGYNKNNALDIGTFNRTGEKILEFAKQHKEYKWIFKPHPTLKKALIDDTKYGKEFCENYFKEWQNLGFVYEQGNYFEIFNNSDLLITDCASFLLEYMPTGKPIIRLVKTNSKAKLSPVGELVVSGIYQVTDFNSFKEEFNNLMLKNSDYLKEKRKQIVAELTNNGQSASENILNALIKIIKDN